MNRISKLTLTLTYLLSFSILFSGSALAFNVLGPTCGQPGVNISDSNVCKDANNSTDPISGPNGIITKAVEVFAILIGVAAVVTIIVAGLRFVTSGGDPQKVATAKNTIVFALVGILVAALAQAIVFFVLNKL